MKCKVCNGNLTPQMSKCPFCGTPVKRTDSQGTRNFKWNVQDFPEPKKPDDLLVDWQSGRILNKSTGKVYDLSSDSWTQPENIDELFSFDFGNAQNQAILDKQISKTSENTSRMNGSPFSAGSFNKRSSISSSISEDFSERFGDLLGGSDSGSSKQQGGGSGSSEGGRGVADSLPDFDWSPIAKYHENPSASAAKKKKTSGRAPEMFDWSSLDNDNSNQPKKESSSNVKWSADSSSAVPDSPSSGEAADSVDYSERPSKTRTFSFHMPDETSAPIPVASNPPSDANTVESAADASGESSDDELFGGFSKLIQAEKKFRDDMERITFLDPDEYALAENAETYSQKLRLVPTISFRTVEDEYEEYLSVHGRDEKTADEKDKQVQIKINEPSGTKVTVKTQEVSLASSGDEEKVNTRRVEMNAIKNAPKNVQVSVEINAAKGNASVEVARLHDGTTMVKTTGEASEEHTYIDGREVSETTDVPAVSDIPDASASQDDIPVCDAPVPQQDDTAPQQDESDTAVAGSSDFTYPMESPAEMHASNDNIADGLKSSEAVQQTVRIPVAEAAAMAEAIANGQPDSGSQPDDGDSENAAAAANNTALADGENAEGTQPAADSAQQADNTAEALPGETGESQDNFWSKPNGSSKMTITDIFGPEARRVLNDCVDTGAIVPESTADQAQQEQSPHRSTIMDINPDDIAVSESQAEAMRRETSRISELGEKGVSTETISDERQAEMTAAFEALEEIKEDESSDKRNIRRKKKAEREAQRAEKTRLKAEKKTAAHDGSQANENTDDESSGERSFGTVAKVLIITLSIILAVEFLVIGIKLFAPDSGAAVLINRIETQISDSI